MAEKKQQSSSAAAPRKSAGAGTTAEKSGGKKSVVAKAAGGITAKLSQTGKAAVAKAADMTATTPKKATRTATKSVAVPAAAASTGAAPTRAAARKKTPDLRKDLRDFAAGRPQGWGHDDWLKFLESLKSRGHNINDQEAIGLALERERLDVALGSIKGLGPQRRQALVDRYGTLWALRGADASEIARSGNLPADLAQRVKSELPGAV